MNLDPFQHEGAEFLAFAKAKGALLADEPGLGKTRQAIKAAVTRIAVRNAVAARWRAHASLVTVFIFCPAAALPVWRRETRQLAPHIKWIILGYNRAHMVDPAALKGAIVILDEAHYLKTPGSGRTADVFGPETDGVGGLIEHAAHVYLLTGTPTPNNPSEIWAMARACFPEAIMKTYADGSKRPMNFWQFAQRYCRTKTDYLGHMKIVAGGKHTDELRARLQPYFLRRLSKDVYKDMKDPRHSVLPVEGSLMQTAFEQEEAGLIRRTLAAKGVEGLRDLSTECATVRRFTGMAKVQGVAEWIDEHLKGGGGPLVAFCYHKDVLRALSNDLARRKIKVVHGGPGADALFQDDPTQQVFLGQIQRDGVAITLTRAKTCLLVESSWVPSDNEQAWKRIYRRGQTGLCDIRWAALAGSIDEDVTAAWVRKQATISELWNNSDSKLETVER